MSPLFYRPGTKLARQTSILSYELRFRFFIYFFFRGGLGKTNFQMKSYERCLILIFNNH